MSVPTSAPITSAVRRPTTGIVSRRARLGVRCEADGNLGAERGALVLKAVEQHELALEHAALMVRHAPTHGRLPRRPAGARLPFPQRRKPSSVGLPRRQRRQDRAPRHAQEVGDHRVPHAVRPFPQGVDAVDRRRARLNQAGAVAYQFAQLPLRPARDEAGMQQPLAQHLRLKRPQAAGSGRP